jgi:tRNA-splicing ligase RtcB
MIFGTHDEKTLAQFEDVKSRAVRAALMADGHMGYIMPIGGVAAYDNMVSVAGVGFDIACGNAAIRTDAKISDFDTRELNRVANDIQSMISFGIGRSNKAKDAPTDHELFSSDAWDVLKDVTGNGQKHVILKAKAREQLGTVGSGNHYVDVFVDRNDGHLWVGVHFGSRGLGHSIASGFMALSQNKSWDEKVQEVEALLSLDSDLGKAYWELMTLAGEYAYVGREWVARTVVNILGANELDLVHNHHNFAWKEMHLTGYSDQVKELVVVRKGATPAFPGQRGFVGGSMGDDAVILKGTDSGTKFEASWAAEDCMRNFLFAEQNDALFSTVHGAGRVMSRTEAAGKRDRKTGQLKLDKETGLPVKPGKVTPDMMNNWISDKGVILRGGGLDESPHAYRRLPDVLKAQGSSVTVLHTLRPLIVVMAGANEFDPYAD